VRGVLGDGNGTVQVLAPRATNLSERTAGVQLSDSTPSPRFRRSANLALRSSALRTGALT